MWPKYEASYEATQLEVEFHSMWRYAAIIAMGLMGTSALGGINPTVSLDPAERSASGTIAAPSGPIKIIPEDFQDEHSDKTRHLVNEDELPSIWVAESDQPKSVEPGDLIGAVKGDWNSDGLDDFALLSVNNEDGYGVRLTVHEAVKLGRLTKVAEISFPYGVNTLIARRSDTVFAVSTGQRTGRHDWSTEIIFAFREGDYVIAGINLWEADSMEPGNEKRCEWNLRTGLIIEKYGLDGDSPTKSKQRISPQHALLEDFLDVRDRAFQLCKY